MRKFQDMFGDEVNVIMGNANTCISDPANSWFGNFQSNCDAGMMVLNNRAPYAIMQTRALHQTEIYSPSGDLVLSIGNDDQGCDWWPAPRDGYKPANALAHEQAVIAKIQEMLSATPTQPQTTTAPPAQLTTRTPEAPDPCRANNGGCNQTCTNANGQAQCGCRATHQMDRQGVCQAGLVVQNSNSHKCVHRNLVSTLTATACDRTASDNPALLAFVDGQLHALDEGNQCLTATGRVASPENVRLEACDPADAMQQWQCLLDGRIQLKAADDLFLLVDDQFKQCNASHTPAMCQSEHLQVRAFADRTGCDFCKRSKGMCGTYVDYCNDADKKLITDSCGGLGAADVTDTCLRPVQSSSQMSDLCQQCLHDGACHHLDMMLQVPDSPSAAGDGGGSPVLVALAIGLPLLVAHL